MVQKKNGPCQSQIFLLLALMFHTLMLFVTVCFNDVNIIVVNDAAVVVVVLALSASSATVTVMSLLKTV